MKIKKLILKNYKVFDHLELDFTDKNGQVLDTIVLAGLNGTGKTTILELLTDLMNGELENILQPDTEIILQIIVDSMFLKSKKGEYLSIAHESESKYLVTTKYTKASIHVTLPRQQNMTISDKLAEIVLSPGGLGGYNETTFSQLECLGVLILSSDLDETYKKGITRVIYRTSLNKDGKNLKKYLTAQIQQEVFLNTDIPPRQIFQKKVNSLNKIFDNLIIKSKLIRITDKELIFESFTGKEILFDELSSGEKMLYYMGFVIKNLYINDGVIMIDQPEDSLHPKWQQQITKFFQNVGENNQVILATHSPQIIASVHPESVFVLGVNEETGKVEAFNMATEHKYSFGVEPNRILDEIMGVPARNEAHEAQIKNILQMIKEVKFNLSKVTIEDVEQAIAILEQDYGKQDLTIMRFQNEVWLLKRKVAVAK